MAGGARFTYNENKPKITSPCNYISVRVDISHWLDSFKHKPGKQNRIIIIIMHVFNLQVQTAGERSLLAFPERSAIFFSGPHF